MRRSTRFLTLAAIGGLASVLCLGQTGPGASVIEERQYVCSEDFKVPHEIPFANPIACPRCPDPPTWEIEVGPAGRTLFLRFPTLTPKARKDLRVSGSAKWMEDGRLRLESGSTTIRGFRPDASGRLPGALGEVEPPRRETPVRDAGASTAERSASSIDRRVPGVERSARLPGSPAWAGASDIGDGLNLNVRYSYGPMIAGDRRLSFIARPCRIATGTGPPPTRRIAVLNGDDFDHPAFIAVYDALANGDVAPLRVIRGDQTHLADSVSIDGDATGRIFVLNNSLPGGNPFALQPTVTVYDASANGNAAPIRMIRSSSIHGHFGRDMAVDDAGWTFVSVAGESEPLFNPGPARGIAVFAPFANGDAAPSQVISAEVGMAVAIAVNRAGSKLYVADMSRSVDAGEVLVFDKDPTGAFRLTGRFPPTEPAAMWGIAVDASGDVFVLTATPDPFFQRLPPNPRVFRFHPDASGALTVNGIFPASDFNGAIRALGGYLCSPDWSLGGGGVHIFRVNPSPLPEVARIMGPNTRLDRPLAAAFIP